MRGGGSGAAHVSCGFVRMDDANAGREETCAVGKSAQQSAKSRPMAERHYVRGRA